MNGSFKITLIHKRKPGFRPKPGEAGEYGPWDHIARYIAKNGIEKVKDVRHDDRDSTQPNQKNFTKEEMLELWKAVDEQKTK